MKYFIYLLGIGLLGLTACSKNNQKFTIIVSDQATEAVHIGAGDVSKYLTQVIAGAEVETTDPGTVPIDNGNVIAIGNRTNNAFIGQLAKEGKLSEAPEKWNSFKITTLIDSVNSRTIYVLEGADKMGQQYACYDFCEKALGIRFLGIEIEYIPQLKSLLPFDNKGIESPQFKYRGMQIWNYHYNQRGTGNFSDINDRFLAKDWEWYKKMADWFVKNKQNYVQWYDETMSSEPISEKIGDEVIDYFAMRGIKRLLGLGWAANEGKPEDWVLGEHEFDTSKVCVGADGKVIGHEHDFTVAACPMVDAYFPLAQENIDAFDLSKKDIIGAVIGYGETERSQRSFNGCIRHDHIPAHDLILKDLNFATNAIQEKVDKKINTGFVIMDFGGEQAPLRTKKMFDALPDSTILFLWTYRDFTWEGNRDLYNWTKEAKEEGKTVQLFQQAEVDFICQSDVPNIRFDVWKRREAHFRSVKDLDIVGHSTNYNTNQYLMWLTYWQYMRWQWNLDDQSWDKKLFETTEYIGGEYGVELTELFKRVISLEFVIDYEAFDSVAGTSTEMGGIPHWQRWGPSDDYNDDHGFMLWAKIKNLELLNAGEENLKAARNLMHELKSNANNDIFNKHMYPVLNYTLDYYQLRIHLGKMATHIANYKDGGDRSLLNEAIVEAKHALDAEQNYNEHMVQKTDKFKDFIFNPSHELLENYLNMLQIASTDPNNNSLESFKPFDWKDHKEFFEQNGF